MDIINEIKKLKKEKEAIILAHYYVNDELQEIADYVGDSFYLSKIAATTNAKQIIFAGVKFMGESAKILNYDKRVFLLDENATCAMAHMATVKRILEMKSKYENLAVVCYINSTMELKKYSDVCVTSANAIKIVSKLPNKNIFFIPDQNLGNYVKEQVKDKSIIVNDGFCPIHHEVKLDSVRKLKKQFPLAIVLAHPECKREILEEADFIGSTSMIIDAVNNYDNDEFRKLKKQFPLAIVLAHPECKREILEEADFIGSTSMIIDAVNNYDNDEFIVLTENGVLYELRNKYPNKQFYEVREQMVCLDMKKNTIEKLYDVLVNETNEVKISIEDRNLALKPLEEMLRYAK